ncbi:LysR family transcriptional regulator [Lichenicola cladoniae]|uniref:LysR family transcriptional regulator n=2 Tax=Lichenicola cladoniae TaxID=1484109 RepID=A0A6M8HW91_9PROT|nr:LysR family transcriptional regulator [Acetobacteraceae bacterium]QKE92652.1 LysR family transcriptional regulator [Lichenicola cladoniae]
MMRQEPNRAGEMAVFAQVVENGSFTQASRLVGLSPSAVSKLITRLEQRLGVTLLRRSTRRIALTPEGELFHGRALGILAEIDLAEREAAGSRLPSGRIRINSSASYVSHVLTAILLEFLERYPDIGIEIIQTDAVSDLLKDGTDVAIRAGPLPTSSLVARALGESALVVVAAPVWIERHGMPANADDLPARDRMGFAYARAAGDWLRTGEAVPARVRVSDGEGIRRLALAGIAPARLAEFTIRAEIARGNLVVLPTTEHEMKLEPFHAVYVGKSGKLPARIRVFLDYLATEGRVDAQRPLTSLAGNT